MVPRKQDQHETEAKEVSIVAMEGNSRGKVDTSCRGQLRGGADQEERPGRNVSKKMEPRDYEYVLCLNVLGEIDSWAEFRIDSVVST